MIRVAVGGAFILALAAGRPALRASPDLRTRVDTLVVRAPREVRVVIGSARDELSIGGAEPWRLVDAWGRTHATAGGETSWRLERDGRRLRAVPATGGRPTAWSDEPFTLMPAATGGFVAWQDRRYRGELRYVATDTAVVLVNVLPLEDYLRGVVPLEIGPRRQEERAAAEAQAIAARSYTAVRALEGVTRSWDLTARATDQVYGGVTAESAIGDSAIRATASLVLTWSGQVVRAPYHSTCGGHTAAPGEVFQGATDGWLRAVTDRVPGTDRSWCDISPRFTWERRWAPAALGRLLARTPAGRGITRVERVDRGGLTASGRMTHLTFHADRGAVRLGGNDLRFALTTVGGEILPSTYFSVAWSTADGLVLEGRGNGHGVGLCQWGAIGRARAGMDAASILRAYYPGTTLAQVR